MSPWPWLNKKPKKPSHAKGSPPNGHASSSLTPMGAAPSAQQQCLDGVLHGNVDQVREALSQGADCNIPISVFQGVLKRTTCHLGHNDIVEVLLQHGANANAGTLSAGPPEAHGGDDVLAKDVTALHMAASKGDAKLVKLLIKFGANINASTMALDRHTGTWRRGWTALHTASLKGHTDVVHTLLHHDAFVNATVDSGFTALHYACYADRVEIVRLLLRNGASPAVPSKSGKWPLDLASDITIHELLHKYLRKSGEGPPPGSSTGKLLRLNSGINIANLLNNRKIKDPFYLNSIFQPALDQLTALAVRNDYYKLFGIVGSIPSRDELIRAKRDFEQESIKRGSADGAQDESLGEPEWTLRGKMIGLVWENVFKHEDLLHAYNKWQLIRNELLPVLLDQPLSALERWHHRVEATEKEFARFGHIDFLRYGIWEEICMCKDILVKAVKCCE